MIALDDARVAAASIVAVYSVVVDALTRRLLELAVGGGEPAAPFAWLALGSQARREATPSVGPRQRDRVVRGSRGRGPPVPARDRADGRHRAERCGLP